MSIFWKPKFLKFDRFRRFMVGNKRFQFVQLSVFNFIGELFLKVASKISEILQEVVRYVASHLL